MTSAPVLAVVVAAALSGLPGCAADPAGAPSAGSPSAEQVIVTQTGGIGGVSNTWRVSADHSPSSGMSAAQVRRMLAVASTPAFRSMTVPTVPPDYCCDQFYYEVTVRYADGSMRHYRTAEGLDWPAPLQALLRAIG